MKETPEFLPSTKVFKWGMGDWDKGRLEVVLPEGSKVVGFWVYKWVGKERIPKATAGEVDDNVLTLLRPPKEDWDGCVTVLYIPRMTP